MSNKITISYEFTLNKDELQEERGDEYVEVGFDELRENLQIADKKDCLLGVVKQLVEDIDLDRSDIVDQGVQERADYSIESEEARDDDES